MKKQVVGVFISLVVCLLFITALPSASSTESKTTETLPQQTQVAKPQETPAPPVLVNPNVVQAAEVVYGEPRRLRISSIGLDAPVVSVGANEKGLQEVPSDKDTVSWWKPGFKPGKKGSAVFAGHFKVEDGSPGVFYTLNQVKVGDTIELTDEIGQPLKFTVNDTKVYSVADFPTEDIYMNTDSNRIVLVTCTGSFISSQNDYSHRFVAYAVLVE